MSRYKRKQLEQLTIKEVFEVLKEVSIQPYDGESIAPERSGSFGYYDPNTRTVHYDASRGENARIRTLMHELTHAYNDIFEARDSERNANAVEKKTFEEYKWLKDVFGDGDEGI